MDKINKHDHTCILGHVLIGFWREWGKHGWGSWSLFFIIGKRKVSELLSLQSQHCSPQSQSFVLWHTSVLKSDSNSSNTTCSLSLACSRCPVIDRAHKAPIWKLCSSAHTKKKGKRKIELWCVKLMLSVCRGQRGSACTVRALTYENTSVIASR